MVKSASEVWILDVSGSMQGPRYLKMKVQAHRLYLERNEPAIVCLAFASDVTEVESPDKLPDPDGATDLAEALRRACDYFPGTVKVFSDGLPDDEQAALDEASRLPGTVSTVYFGEDKDAKAKAFMEKLARRNGGMYVAKDLLKNASLLEADVREVLGLPAPIAL